MTKEEMLAKVRMFADEATEDFYLDDEEIYPALSEAQVEVVRQIANQWFYNGRERLKPMPRSLNGLVTNVSGTISTGAYQFVYPTLFVIPVTLQWNPNSSAPASGKYCLPVNETNEMNRLKANQYLAGGYYMAWDGTSIFLNPVSADASAGYSLQYIKMPVDITVSVEPESGSDCHDAIVERAMWILMKDREAQIAQAHLQLYATLLQGLTQ
jgi:hypothetical protein